ncbi:hypothetical protein EIM50_21895 [Pseudoxanthomonas sp. SGD-10]|nr:hypothetical protein EIM50_21895 [Pseudoxanthomonas sp. SGD-10]
MDKQIIGIVAGILTSTSLIPQAVKSWKDKKASDVSYLMFFILLAGNGLWAWYGILLQDWPIIITNAFAFLMDLLMISLKWKFAKNEK